MKTEYFLELSDVSILIVKENPNNKVVIGVPHHAPLGTVVLNCNGKKRDADENAGYIGYNIAQMLNCSYIIACNYFIDPNKCTCTDYYKKIHFLKPMYFVEIHGHGGKSAIFDIEISSGTADRNKWSEEMAIRLKKNLNDSAVLNRYTISGDFNSIHFQAKNSETITSTEWIPFHIELPISIRNNPDEYILFGELLAKTINSLVTDFEMLNSK